MPERCRTPRLTFVHPLFARPCMAVCGPRSNGRFVNLHLALYNCRLTWFRWLLPRLRVSVPRCDRESTHRAVLVCRVTREFKELPFSSKCRQTSFQRLTEVFSGGFGIFEGYVGWIISRQRNEPWNSCRFPAFWKSCGSSTEQRIA